MRRASKRKPACGMMIQQQNDLKFWVFGFGYRQWPFAPNVINVLFAVSLRGLLLLAADARDDWCNNLAAGAQVPSLQNKKALKGTFQSSSLHGSFTVGLQASRECVLLHASNSIAALRGFPIRTQQLRRRC